MPGDAEQLSNGGNYNDPASGIHFVEATWHCVEVLFDGGHDELRVWFEGNEVPELHVTDWKRGDVGWSPTYAAIRFGYAIAGLVRRHCDRDGQDWVFAVSGCCTTLDTWVFRFVGGPFGLGIHHVSVCFSAGIAVQGRDSGAVSVS